MKCTFIFDVGRQEVVGIMFQLVYVLLVQEKESFWNYTCNFYLNLKFFSNEKNHIKKYVMVGRSR